MEGKSMLYIEGQADKPMTIAESRRFWRKEAQKCTRDTETKTPTEKE